MKLLAEHLDTAITFEQMAATERDPKLKAELEKASRRLSQARGKESEGIRANSKLLSAPSPLSAAKEI